MCTQMDARTDIDVTRDRLADDAAASVLAVDDQKPFRALLCRLVKETPGLVVVGEADCGEQAVELAQLLEPALVLMDVRMPGIGGIAATTQIKELRPRTIVVLVSTTHPEQLEGAAAECAADAVVWKSDLRPSLLGDLWRTHGSR
jgi:NarL family two-component system response regulator LiaR